MVLNGSPKREKSDTMHVTRAFSDGMRDYGEQEITQTDAIDETLLAEIRSPMIPEETYAAIVNAKK